MSSPHSTAAPAKSFIEQHSRTLLTKGQFPQLLAWAQTYQDLPEDIRLEHAQDLANFLCSAPISLEDRPGMEAHGGAIITHLCSMGVDPNQINFNSTWEYPLLLCAVEEGHVSIVQALLHLGANLHITAREGETVWMSLTEDNPSMMRLLLDRGADINAVDNRFHTPLWNAARSNLPETLEFLIANGATIDHIDDNGNTALHHLAMDMQRYNDDLYPIVTRLVMAGLDPEIRNNNNHTVMDRIPDRLRRAKMEVAIQEAFTILQSGELEQATTAAHSNPSRARL